MRLTDPVLQMWRRLLRPAAEHADTVRFRRILALGAVRTGLWP